MKEIEVTIDENGKVDIDLNGFHGKGCDEIAKKLAKAMGSIVNIDKKCDFYKQEVQTKTKQKIVGG